MTICSKFHDEICYEGLSCPACQCFEAAEALRAELERLRDELEARRDQ